MKKVAMPKNAAVQIRHGLTLKAVIRTGVAASAFSLAAVAMAGPAWALDRYVEAQNCSQPQGDQLCPAAATFTYDHGDAPGVRLDFTASQGHCSDIIARITVDGASVAAIIVGPGETDGGVIVPLTEGPHVIGAQGEGLTGGCNTGKLSSWAGTVHITDVT
jgi:hypothetical protein